MEGSETNFFSLLNIEKNFKYLNDKYIYDNLSDIDKILRIVRIRKDLYGKKIIKNEGKLRRLVYKQIAFWDNILKKTNPRLVIFESYPHLVHHYTLYFIAKIRGIKTIIFSRIGDPVRFMVADDIDNLHPHKIINNNKEIQTVVPIRKKPDYAVSQQSKNITVIDLIKKIVNLEFKKFFNINCYRAFYNHSKSILYSVPYLILYKSLSVDILPSKKIHLFSSA